MKFRIALVVPVILLVASICAHSQSIDPIPSSSDVRVTIDTAPAIAGSSITLHTSAAAATCASGKVVSLQTPKDNLVGSKADTTVVVKKGSLKAKSYLCAAIAGSDGRTVTTPAVQVASPAASTAKNAKPAGGAKPANDAGATGDTTKDEETEVAKDVSGHCDDPRCFPKTSLDYSLLGGIEQSDLSAQSSVTEGFYDLFMREPFQGDGGSIWFRSRYLGTPSSSARQNIVAAATNPTGTLTAANLPQSVTAVDYTVGYQFAKISGSFYRGRLTLNPVLGFGATTPLSATTVVSGYAVPAFGTDACTQLQARFTAKMGYNPPLPSPGVINGTNYCVVQPNPASTASKSLAGTKITDIGFSNEDRSSFLIKWGVGMRITDRWFVKPDKTTWCDSDAGCDHLTADIAVGQDEVITGGKLRHFVLKGDLVVPIKTTGFYFFAASSNRLERDATLSPLILSPVTLATSTSTAKCTPSTTTVCYPAADVFILPYKQQDRDFYRIGLGIDALKIFKQLFGAATTETPKTSKTAKPAPADNPAAD